MGIKHRVAQYCKRKEFFVPFFIFTLFLSVFFILENLHRPEGTGEIQSSLSNGEHYLLVNTEDYGEDAFEQYDDEVSEWSSVSEDASNSQSQEEEMSNLSEELLEEGGS